jgi:hypothetical protein
MIETWVEVLKMDRMEQADLMVRAGRLTWE